jgi:hypothetical protein
MEHEWFDALSRALGNGATRRGALGATPGQGMLAPLDLETTVTPESDADALGAPRERPPLRNRGRPR